MTFLEILLTIIGAVLVGALFYYIFKSTGPWGSFWSFMLILILAGLAAEAWITPFGPVYWDVAWIPTMFVVLLFALLLAAATPSRSETTAKEYREAGADKETATETAVAVSGFFWILLVFLLIAAIWGLFV